MPNLLHLFTDHHSPSERNDCFPADLYSRLINSCAKSLQHFNDDEISVGNNKVAQRMTSIAKRQSRFPARMSQVNESLDIRK